MRAAILALTLFCSSQALAQQPCLRAGQEGAVVSGRLEAVQYSDASGRRGSALILSVHVPVCLSGSDRDDNVKPAARVHVFSSDGATHKQLQGAVGKSLRLRGEAFVAHTVHHRAPIVFNVNAIAQP
ncbi:MAG: hypothetical protein FJX29_10255 [Alphaproteobacteria bacterium]|nr:hypothetical protein [Alphaproteobacteria bacterium]